MRTAETKSSFVTDDFFAFEMGRSTEELVEDFHGFFDLTFRRHDVGDVLAVDSLAGDKVSDGDFELHEAGSEERHGAGCLGDLLGTLLIQEDVTHLVFLDEAGLVTGKLYPSVKNKFDAAHEGAFLSANEM